MPFVKIDGTWHEIDTPSAKIGGTWMEMDTGYCKIDGTWHEWDMGPSPIPVTITGTGSSSNCYATINGTMYSSAASGIEVLPGDVIHFYTARSASSETIKITIDGTVVKQSSGNTNSISYTWTVPEACKSINIDFSQGGSGGMRVYYNITVTTT